MKLPETNGGIKKYSICTTFINRNRDKKINLNYSKDCEKLNLFKNN